MKFTFISIAIIFVACSCSSQVLIDRAVQLTGGSGQRVLTNLELPVNGTDAVNKDYVDAAVAAGGGSCYPTDMTNEIDANGIPCAGNGCGVLKWMNECSTDCYNLIYNDKTDWRVPTFDEVFNLVAIAPGTSSGNYIWTANRASGPNGHTVYRFSDGREEDRQIDVQAHCRCIR